jgi:NAD(P)H-dependent FMN reductase
VLSSTGARVLGDEVAVGHAQTRFDEEGRLVDDEVRERLDEVVAALVAELSTALSLAATA